MMSFRVVSIFALLLLNTNAWAGVDCSGSRCLYSGEITKIYLSSGGSILVSLDESYPELINGSNDIGIANVTHGEAVGVQMFVEGDENEKGRALEFAKYFFNTALIAKTSGRKVEVQMRSQSNGYLLVDRIWLK